MSHDHDRPTEIPDGGVFEFNGRRWEALFRYTADQTQPPNLAVSLAWADANICLDLVDDVAKHGPKQRRDDFRALHERIRKAIAAAEGGGSNG